VSPPDFRTELDAVLQSRGRFGHREHLELAWRYLHAADVERAQELMSDAIRHVAASHGMPERYHHTITLSWLRLVAVHVSRWDEPTFDAFMERNPGLLDRHLLSHHFTGEVLGSADARAAWIDPDLRALPAL
jgi:hypothetical protein